MSRVLRVVFAACMVLGLAGCNEPKQISGNEFMAMKARNPESMRHTEFIGVKDDRAILKVSKMSIVNKKRWNDTYFVTDVDNLPAEWVEKNRPDSQK